MTTWTAAQQAPLPMRFSRQGYWSGLPFPSPGDLPNPGIEPRSPALQADSSPTELQGKQKGKRGDHRFKLTRLKVKSLSHVRLFAITWTAAQQAPLSVGFSRQEYRKGLPLPFLRDLPNPRIKTGLLHCRQILYHLSQHRSLDYCPAHSKCSIRVHRKKDGVPGS